jgi:hypothetical protein
MDYIVFWSLMWSRLNTRESNIPFPIHLQSLCTFRGEYGRGAIIFEGTPIMTSQKQACEYLAELKKRIIKLLQLCFIRSGNLPDSIWAPWLKFLTITYLWKSLWWWCDRFVNQPMGRTENHEMRGVQKASRERDIRKIWRYWFDRENSEISRAWSNVRESDYLNGLCDIKYKI